MRNRIHPSCHRLKTRADGTVGTGRATTFGVWIRTSRNTKRAEQVEQLAIELIVILTVQVFGIWVVITVLRRVCKALKRAADE